MKTRRGGNIFALQKDGMALQHVSKRYENVLAAVKQNGLALQFVPDSMKDKCMAHALHQNISACISKIQR